MAAFAPPALSEPKQQRAQQKPKQVSAGQVKHGADTAAEPRKDRQADRTAKQIAANAQCGVATA